jgi:16S rRNA G966 N2-methylase RsmD
MARHGQVLPPVPAPGANTLCTIVLLSIASAELRCIDLVYIDPPFNSNRNYEVFWGETREKRAFEDRHASTQAYIEFTWKRS